MKKLLFFFTAILCFQISQAQTGTISGIVTDANGEGLPFANVVIVQNGVPTGQGAVTDFDGLYQLDNIAIGTYDLEASYIGHKTVRKSGVVVDAGKNVEINFSLSEAIETLTEVACLSISKPSKKSVFKGKLKDRRSKNTYMQSAPIMDMAVEPDMSHIDNSNTDTDEELPLENSFKPTSEDNMSTFSIDIDHASYTYCEELINTGQKPEKTDIRVEEMVNYFNYDYPLPEGDTPFSIYTEVSDCPWNKDHLLLHIGLKGEEYKMKELPPSNLVFLVDVSGSMTYVNKLGLVKEGLTMMVDKLRPEDRVSIVTYAGNFATVLESTPGDQHKEIKTAINNLASGGGTNGAGGIKQAYKIAKKNFIEDGNNRVILCTDGDFNVGISSIADLQDLIEEKRKTGVFLTALGFGMGNYKDQTLETLADKGNGNYAYINDRDEAKKVFFEDITQNIFTIAKDVKIQMHFDEEKVKAFRLIGYDNRMLEHQDFEDDTKDAGEINAGHTVTAMYEIVPQEGVSAYMEAAKELEATISEQPIEVGDNNNLGIIKLRYKAPDEETSKEIIKDILPQENTLVNSSDNFRWAAAVAIFGLSLQDSDYLKKANLKSAKELAKSAIGKDKRGMRKEFIALIDKAQKI